MTPKTDKYLIFVWGDTEPEVMGPYATEETRDAKARWLRKTEGDAHGIYLLDIVDGVPKVDAYSGAFFEKEE